MDSQVDDDDGRQLSDPQIWYKRRCNIEKLGFCDEALYDELLFTMKLLKEKDANNKHAWSQRRWALLKLDTGYADEIGFCNLLLRRDDGSNDNNRLVWDQRWFTVQKCLAKGWTIIKSCEVTYVAGIIICSPECSYPWRFLRSLYKDDMKALARNAHLQWALVCVFVQARDIVNTVTADLLLYENKKHARIIDLVNKRGFLFALDLVSDFLKEGIQLDKEAEEAFEEVFKDVFKDKEYEGSTFACRVGCILREHRMEVMELCADLPGTRSHSAGKIKTSRSFLFPVPCKSGVKRKRTTFPPSHPGYELCGQGGFSTICAQLYPEDARLVRSIRKRKKAEEEDLRRKLNKRKVPDFPQKNDSPYSKLPETLRNVCLGLIEYSGFDSDKHTRFLLFCEGHINPTAWQVRRLTVFVCKLELEAEVNFLEHLSEGSSENPLYWHHRRWVSERIGKTAAAKELDFTEKILLENASHYQAWSHRQWVRQVLCQEEWGEAEVAFCEKIIKNDSSNCYAWNQRYFVSKTYPGMMQKEVQCAKEVILNSDPENEMPWIYLDCLDNLPKNCEEKIT